MMCRLIYFFICAIWSVSSQNLDWWQGGNFYQIYPRSYMDSNGDGVGDLQGIKSKIAYVKGLGMDGVWLSPIMASPQADFGYDISDYRDIHWEYGTLDDFQELLDECKRLDLKLILDFVPNHSSDEHEWFKKSENRVPGYEDYYVWRDGKIDPHTNLLVPPTNWISFFRYQAWRWSPIRKQFYMHQFHYKQPDLNYRDPKLVQEMKEILSYWLQKGVSGFRIDIIVCLFEKMNNDGSFPDEPLGDPNCDYDDYCYVNHIYTQDQDETFDMAYQWRELFDNFKKTNGGETKIIMTESWSDIPLQQRFYGDRKTRNGSYVPFNFEMMKTTNVNSQAKDFKAAVDGWLKDMPKDVEANWVVSCCYKKYFKFHRQDFLQLGNHDQHRLASRLGVDRGDLLNIMIQTLPGIAITYQGEELVMTNVHLTWEETVDPQACNTNQDIYEEHSRDPARTPFPWDDSTNAGFSTGDTTWLPVGNNYKTVNVKAQEEAANSHLKIFRRLTTLRKHSVLRQGTYLGALTNSDNVYAYRRMYQKDVAIVILNFGKTTTSVNVKNLFSSIPDQMKVYTSSLNSGLNNG
jgi:alpha-glucosidase